MAEMLDTVHTHTHTQGDLINNVVENDVNIVLNKHAYKYINDR